MKIWYLIFNRKPYKGFEPSFYDKKEFDWTEIIENNGDEIRRELDVHLSLNPRMIYEKQPQKVNNHGWWKTMPLMTWGIKFHKNINNFPVTSKVLDKIPGVVSASFNLLDKESEISEHIGTTNAFVRVHLGIHIPGKLPEVGFKVKNKTCSWEEGKVFIFCDAYEHSGWNHSKKDRYILLIDVIKPEFMSKKRLICANVLATLALQSILKKTPFMFYLTIIPIVFIHFILKVLALIFTPLNNLFQFL